MKKRYEKKFLTTILTSVLFLMLLTTIVSAQRPLDVDSGIAPSSSSGSFIADMFAKWTEGSLDVNLAKYLLFIIITIVIYSILTTVSFPPKEQAWIRWLLALPIAFLSIAFVTPEEVFSILATYSALGITISVFVPFVLLFFFTVSVIKEDQSMGIFLQVIIWWSFSAFLVYKLLAGIFGFGGNIAGSSSTTLNVMIIFVTILSAIMATANRQIRKSIVKHFIEQHEQRAKNKIARTKSGQELLEAVGSTDDKK